MLLALILQSWSQPSEWDRLNWPHQFLDEAHTAQYWERINPKLENYLSPISVSCLLLWSLSSDPRARCQATQHKTASCRLVSSISNLPGFLSCSYLHAWIPHISTPVVSAYATSYLHRISQAHYQWLLQNQAEWTELMYLAVLNLLVFRFLFLFPWLPLVAPSTPLYSSSPQIWRILTEIQYTWARLPFLSCHTACGLFCSFAHSRPKIASVTRVASQSLLAL